MAAITGGTGPGGFELANGASTLALWLDASDVDANGQPDVLANGSTVTTWVDRSGYARNATTVSGTPSYVLASAAGNNQPSMGLSSVGGDDEMDTAFNFDALGATYSVFGVSRYTGGDNERVITSKTRNWLFGHHGNLEDRFYSEGWIQPTGGSGGAAPTTNFQAYTEIIGTGVAAGPGADIWKNGTQLADNKTGASATIYKPGQIALGRWGVNNTESSNAEVSELIIIDRQVNEAERRIIENALTAKYNLTQAAATEIYAGDTLANGDFDSDMFGIGRLNATNIRSTSGRSGFGIEVAAFADDGDFVAAGHKVINNSLVSTGLPAGVNSRWARTWYVDETDANNNVAATFAFDFSDAGLSLGSNATGFTLLRSTDGGATFSAVPGAASVAGDTISFNVSAADLQDSVYTLGFNQAPVVTPATGASAYLIGAPATTIGTGITINDADSTQLSGATVSIAGFVNTNSDVLSFTPVGAVTGSFNTTTGVLTLTGTDSLANYQTALQSVTFSKPTFQATPSRTINFAVTDTAGATSAVATRTVSIASGSFTWDGDSDADGDGVTWTDPLNWAGNVAPGANDLAIFANLDVGIVNVPSAVSVGSVQFTNTAGSFSLNQITGGTLTLTSGGVVQSGTGSNTIAVPVTLPAAALFDIATGTTLTESGTVAGSGSISKVGAGNLVFGGNNTALTGSISVSGGVLEGSVGGTVAAPTNPFGTAALTIDGGQIRYNRSAALDAGLNRKRVTPAAQPTTTLINYDLAPALSVDTTVNASAAAPAGLGVGHRWTGFVNITTAGNYAFSTNTDDGSRVYIDGVLVLNSDGGHGVVVKTSSNIALTSGLHRIQMDYAEGTAAGNGGYSLSYIGPDQPALGIIPAAVLFQSLPVSFTNNVTVTSAGGTLDVAGTIPGLSLGTLNIGAAGTTNFNVTSVQGRRLDFAATNLQGTNTTVNLDVGQFVGLGRVQDGANTGVTVNKAGAGQLILDNNTAAATANDLNGTTLRISNGRLVNFASNVAGSTIPINNAAIDINGGTLTLDTKIGDYAINNNINVTTSGTIENMAGAVTITHNSGTVNIPAGQTLTYLAYGGDAQVRGSLLEVNAQVVGAGNLTANNVILNTTDGNTGNTGFLRLRNNLNSYSGLTTINGGSLIAFASNALGATSGDTVVNNGGQFRVENGVTIPAGETITINGAGPGSGGAVRNDTGNNTITDKIVLGSAATIVSATAGTTLTLTNGVDVTAATVTFDGSGNTLLPAGTGNITASANENGVTKAGAGTLTLAGTASTYTGVTAFQGGIVNAATITDYGVAGSLGARTLAMESNVGDDIGLVFRNNGTLQYTGSTPQSTNRQIRIQTTGGVIDASGSVPAATLTFSFGGPNINLYDTAGARTLTLTGSNTGANTFNILLTDQAAAPSLTSLSKTGAGVWVLTNNTNTYNGSTSVTGGTLRVTQPNALGGTTGITSVGVGSTLELNGAFTLAAEPISLTGSGAGGVGALNAVGNITLPGRVGTAGDTTIGSATAGTTLTLNGTFNKELQSDLTFIGAGNFTVNSVIADADYTLTPLTSLAYNGVNQAIDTDTVVTGDFNGTNVATRTNTLNGPLTFANAAAFNVLFTPSIPLADTFTTVYYATLTVNTPGVYSFAASNNDDGAAVWIKPAANAAFVTATDRLQGIVANNNTLVASRSLAAGTYTILYAHREGTGAESMTGRLGGPLYNGTVVSTLLPIVNGFATQTGSNNVIMSGTGTLNLAGANTYTGRTTVNSGIVLATNSSALGPNGAGTFVENGATLQLQGGVAIPGEAITLNGLGAVGQLGALVNVSGDNSLTATSSVIAQDSNLGEIRLASLANTLTVAGPVNLRYSKLSTDGAGNITISGNISGVGAAGTGVPTENTATNSGVFDNVAEASNYTLLYELPIGDVTNYAAVNSVPYTINNNVAFTAPFDRIAYYLELQTPGGQYQYVYASMDAFTTNDAQIGVPSNGTSALFQRIVNNMNVFSNQPGIVNATGIATGGIEFWASNYAQALNAVNNPPNQTPSPANASAANFDFGDSGGGTGVGHGSMQLFNTDIDGAGAGTVGQTLFAFNNWNTATSGAAALGIGSRPGTADIDWTFAANVSTYYVRNLVVLARETGGRIYNADNSLVKLGAGTLTLSGNNSFNGATNVNAGTLAVQNGGAISNTAGPVNVANLATFQLLSNETVSSFVGADDGATENDSLLALGANTLTTIGSATIANVTSANGGIVAGTNLIDGDTDSNVSGTGVFLGATAGSVGSLANPIETAVSNLEGSAATGFFVASSTALTIGGVSVANGIAATNDVVVTSTVSLTVAENITATGAGSDVTLTSIDVAGAGQNLAVNSTATISSPNGLIVLNAGDNATISGRLASGNTITVNIDAGNADPGTAGSLQFDGDVDAPLAIFNGGADTVGDSFSTIRPDQDTADVLTPIQVFGLAPNANPNGDTLVLDITGLGIPTLTLGPGARNGSFSFGTLAAPLTYNNIENVSTSPALPYHLVLDMQFAGFQNGAADTILAQLNAAGTDLLLDVNGGNVFTGPKNVIQSLTIIGSSDNDALTIQETAGGLPSFLGGAPVVNNTGVGGGVSNGSHLNNSADLAMETLVPGGAPWNGADVTFHFDGGAAGTDSLTLNRTVNTLLGYYSDTADAGNSGNLISPFTPFLLSFANLEPLVLNGAGGGLITDATSTPATSNLTITDIGTTTQVVGDGGFAPTTYGGFTDLLVNGGDGSELIDLVSIDPATLTLVRLNGGNTSDSLGQPGGDAAADTLRIRSLPASVQALMFGAAGSDLFQLFDAGNTVDNIAGLVTVDGADGNVGGNTDTLTIVNTGGATADNVVIAPLNSAASQDYTIDGLTTVVGNDVVFRNIDDLNYTGTALADTIDGRFTNTVPTHDLGIVNLSGWTGADQFLLFTSDQIGGTGANNTPTGNSSTLSNINLYGDAPGNPNGGDGNDTFGATPPGVIATGIMNVGLVVSDNVRMIRPSATTAIAIDGGTPTGLAAPLGDVAGDVLNVNISQLPNSTPVIVSTFAPGTVVAGGIQPLTWVEIEDINVVDQGKLTNVQMGDLFARTTPNPDLVQITRNPTPLNPNQVRLRITATIGNYSASNKTIIYGGALNDTITQSNLTIPAEFYGEAGDDYLTGATNNDWLVGGANNDRINGGQGDNVIWGDNSPTLPTDPQPQDLVAGGDDQLSGLSGNDVFYGGGGNDLVSAGGGNDYAYGGEGNDTLDGNDGDDRLYGGNGNDIIHGHAGNDLLSGAANDDKLYGDTGNDVLFGGLGVDLIDGGEGNDLLVSGSVAGESSSWTSLPTTSTYSPATYTLGTDNDAALLTLLAAWASTSNRGTLGTSPAITHDGVNDDLWGGTGDDDFCWESADVIDNFPGTTPPDYNASGMGTDERFGPT